MESFPRDVCILEEACNLFCDDKIRVYDLGAAAVRQALASVPDAMSTTVRVTDILKPNKELIKGVDTVVLRAKDEVDLSTLLAAIQESHAEVTAVEWEVTPIKQRALAPTTVLFQLYLLMCRPSPSGRMHDFP